MLKLALLLLLCVLAYELVRALRKASDKRGGQSDETVGVDPSRAVEAEFETQEPQAQQAESHDDNDTGS